jgi:hypothetical protein
MKNLIIDVPLKRRIYSYLYSAIFQNQGSIPQFFIHSFYSAAPVVFRFKKSYPCNRPWRPTRLSDVEAPTFSR